MFNTRDPRTVIAQSRDLVWGGEGVVSASLSHRLHLPAAAEHLSLFLKPSRGRNATSERRGRESDQPSLSQASPWLVTQSCQGWHVVLGMGASREPLELGRHLA